MAIQATKVYIFKFKSSTWFCMHLYLYYIRLEKIGDLLYALD